MLSADNLSLSAMNKGLCQSMTEAFVVTVNNDTVSNNDNRTSLPIVTQGVRDKGCLTIYGVINGYTYWPDSPYRSLFVQDLSEKIFLWVLWRGAVSQGTSDKRTRSHGSRSGTSDQFGSESGTSDKRTRQWSQPHLVACLGCTASDQRLAQCRIRFHGSSTRDPRKNIFATTRKKFICQIRPPNLPVLHFPNISLEGNHEDEARPEPCVRLLDYPVHRRQRQTTQIQH